MTRKQNRTCESCGYIYSTPQKLRAHYASSKNPCRSQDLPNQSPAPQPNPEIEYLDALGLFDPPEITESIPSPEAEREYLEALGILEPIPQFHQTDIISSGCELLDDHYKVEIGKESIYYSKDPINTLDVLREQIINIFNDRFDLTHGFKTRLCLTGKMSRSANYQQGLFDDKIEEDNGEEDYKEVPFKNKAVVVTSKEDIPRIVDGLIWDIENRIETYIVDGSGWYFVVTEDVNIEMPIFVPLTASSHLPLPKGIPKRNNGIINIKNEDNRCFEYCILAELYPQQYHRERVSWYTPYLGTLDFNGIQFPIKADKDTMEKFEKQNPAISVSIYGWSEKELIPKRIASKSKVHDRCNHKEGNCQPRKLIRLLLITGDDPETGEPSQHYCLIQGRDGLGKLAGYTTKHNGKLYVCDYCVSHRTHDPKIDAQHMEDCEGINTPVQRTEMPKEGKNIYKFRRYERMLDAPFVCIGDSETLSTLTEKNQGSKTTAIQEHKVIGFDYIIKRSDGKTKAPVKIRGDDPAGDFIKAMEKENEQCQDFLAGGHVIRKNAKSLCKLLESEILPETKTKEFLDIFIPYQDWDVTVTMRECDKEILTRIKNYLKGLYQAHRRDPLGVDIGIMYRLTNTLYCRLRWPGEPMKKLTVQEEKTHKSAKECWICNKPFGEDNLKKVHDHDHITGNYRGPAHSICNLQLRIKPEEFKLPIRFHNLGKFDAHLISQAMGRVSKEKISAIPHNMENYLSLDIGNQRYMDSLQLMPGSLDSHISNLGAEPCKEEVDKDGNSLNLPCKKPSHLYRIDSDRCFAHPERFPITREHGPKGRDDLVFRKAPFPYDWFNTPEKMDTTSLPPIEAFDSILNKSKCSEKAYKIAQEVWKSFDMKTFRDYHDFYLNLDVLLLADCLEGFRKLMKGKFGLDIAHYVSLPSFAEDALYKTTGQEIELFTDDNMYLFCEKGIRGGITMVSNRQVKANNPQCPDFIPDTEEAIKKLYTWLLYVDANALYTGAMMQAMPTGGHRWIMPEETPDLFNKISKCEIRDDADKGYILEVDLDYPYKLHKAHTSYPLAPENIEISKEEMSKYGQDLIKELKHYTKTKKLVPNLNNKQKYIVHYRALQFYIKQGMVLTKIHRAIEFDQSPWMKPFMEELARSRALAKNDFEKNMYKLLGNANYGKTVENVRKYQRIDFVRPEGESKKFKKLVADPSYKSHRILAENLVGISRHQSKARLSKPIFIGMTVLDESKITMYNFYYNVLKPRYGDNVELIYTDTDSLILLIKTEDVYKDMVEMYEYFDFSDYKPEHHIYQALGKEKIILNKKVPGKFKDESCGTAMWKFCGPRPKLYSYILADGKTDRRAKGVQKVVVKKNLTHDMYENCLKSRKETMITMHRLGSKDHIIRLLRSSKIGISPLDTKRWILSDGITTLAFGDWRIRAYKKFIASGISHEKAEKRMMMLELKPQYQ